MLWSIEPLACPCREVLTVASLPPLRKSIKIIVADVVGQRGAEWIIAEEWKLDPSRAKLVCMEGKGARIKGRKEHAGRGICVTVKKG